MYFDKNKIIKILKSSHSPHNQSKRTYQSAKRQNKSKSKWTSTCNVVYLFISQPHIYIIYLCKLLIVFLLLFVSPNLLKNTKVIEGLMGIEEIAADIRSILILSFIFFVKLTQMVEIKVGFILFIG